MNTLMIATRTQGISFNAAEATAPFAIVEKLAGFAGALIKAFRAPAGHNSFRPAHA